MRHHPPARYKAFIGWCMIFMFAAAVLGQCFNPGLAAAPPVMFPLVFKPPATSTPTPTDTPLPTSTPTTTPSPPATDTATVTPTPTNSPTATSTPTSTATPSSIASHTPSPSPTPSPTATHPITINDVIDYLDGRGLIYSGENAPVYLGTISSRCYWSESIVNEYGRYGSEYSSVSISNEYGRYGSPYSSYSAFNEYASHPPGILTWDGYQWLFWAYVTNNPYKSPRMDSAYLLAYLRWKGGC